MIEKIFMRFIYEFYYLIFLLSEKIGKYPRENKVAKSFLNFNNRRILKKIGNKEIDKILILLPHCLQKYSCLLKITSDINNCRECGQCVIADFVKLNSLSSVDVKIATGGTLARKHIKDTKPQLVLAVACKRDLISGIHDAYPVNVYGVFNKIIDEPCINTTVAIDIIKDFLEKFIKNKREDKK